MDSAAATDAITGVATPMMTMTFNGIVETTVATLRVTAVLVVISMGLP